jgi:hypothetical protein
MQQVMKSLAFLVFLLVSMFSLTANGEEPALTPDRKNVLEAMAANHAYHLLSSNRTVTLTDGFFSAGADGITARLVASEICELNGDGMPDIAVIIEHHTGGKPGTFELVVLYSSGDGYNESVPFLLGGDISLKALHVEKAGLFMPERIIVTFIAGSMPDSQAHPAFERTRGFWLDGAELRDTMSLEVVKKPALYLYPEKETTVEVRLGPKGRITRTIPRCQGRWVVTVGKDGLIDRKYRYLFYEAELSSPIAQPEEGWCLRRTDLRSRMGSLLARLGLNSREAGDFKAYWLKNLSGSRFWIVRLIRPEVVDDQLGLAIQPKPQSIMRVIFTFTPSANMAKLREPEITKFERKGFTAVEWGGILEGGNTKRGGNAKEKVK